MTKNVILPVILFRVGLGFINAGRKKLQPELEKLLGKKLTEELEKEINIGGILSQLGVHIEKKHCTEKPEEKKERTLH